MQIDDVVAGLAAGTGIDLSPDGKTAYYVETSIGELSRVVVRTGKVSTAMTGLDSPLDVEVDWDAREIFVSERNGRVVQVWPGNRFEVVATPGGAPHQLALVKTASNRYLYTVCYESGTLVRIDVDSSWIEEIASGLGHPVGLVIDAAREFAYVTEQDARALTRVELASGTATRIYTDLVAPFYLAWDQDEQGIYCIQRDPKNNLLRLDLGPPVSASIVAEPLAWRPSGVAPSADDSLIYTCADRKLEVISSSGGHAINPRRRPFEIYSIQFRFAGSPALELKDHIAGASVPSPEYIRAVRNGPAAYFRGTLPHIKVILRKRPGYVPGPYAIGATGSLGGVRRKTVTPHFLASGLSDPIDFELMWPLPDFVDKPSVTLDWYARRRDVPSVPVLVGSAAHKIYLVLGNATAPWVAEIPWVAALERACGWAATSSTREEAATLITERYNCSEMISYDTVHGATGYGYEVFNLAAMLERLNGGPGAGPKVNCVDCADTVSTLANVLGCDLWQSKMRTMGLPFKLNEVRPIGYASFAVPFSSGFNFHEVAWEGACTEYDNIYDGCLHVDADSDPTSAPHLALLPTNIRFGDCSTMDYRLRLAPPTADGCARCAPEPASRRRRPLTRPTVAPLLLQAEPAMDHEEYLDDWAETTWLGRRVFNHNYRMSGRELRAWKMVKELTVPAGLGITERVYLWRGKKEREQDLVRISIAELGDWRSAHRRMLEELNHCMRPEIPRGTGALAGTGDVNLVARDPSTDVSAGIFFTRGNVCVTVRSVGEANVDISDVAITLDRILSEPPAEKELQKGLVRRRPPESAVIEADQAHVLIEDLAKEVAPDEWLKVIAPDGELGRRGDALVLVSAEGGTKPISIFLHAVKHT